MSTSEDPDKPEEDSSEIAPAPGAPDANGEGAPPPEVVGAMTRAMSVMASMGNPVLAKIDATHISRVLDLSDRQAERQRDSEKESRLMFIVGGAAILGFIVFIVIYFGREDQSTMREILFPVLGFLGGIAAGFGLGRSRS